MRLVGAGAAGNPPGPDHATPFHCACRGGAADVVRALLKRDDVRVTDPDRLGLTPFHACCVAGHDEVLALLLQVCAPPCLVQASISFFNKIMLF